MDLDGNGYLSESEIRALLQSDAVECSYEDVEEATDLVYHIQGKRVSQS